MASNYPLPRVTTTSRALNPVRFPKNERIPVTEKELHAMGVRFCVHKILGQNRCTAKAKDAYLAEGMDPTKGAEWYYFHLRMCFDKHKAANQCVIDHKEKLLRDRQKKIREKRLGMVHVS